MADISGVFCRFFLTGCCRDGLSRRVGEEETFRQATAFPGCLMSCASHCYERAPFCSCTIRGGSGLSVCLTTFVTAVGTRILSLCCCYSFVFSRQADVSRRLGARKSLAC